MSFPLSKVAQDLASLKTEAELTERMRELCTAAAFGEDRPLSLRRVEVAPSLRPLVWPLAFEGYTNTTEGYNYGYFKDKLHTRLFVHSNGAIQHSYSCGWFTSNCASLSDPLRVHDGALGVFVDNALGYHAIHFAQGVCVTRSLSVTPEQPISLESVVICRNWTRRWSGSKIFVDGDVVDAENHSIRYARMSALFIRIPEEKLKWIVGLDLPHFELQRRLISATEKWEKDALLIYNQPQQQPEEEDSKTAVSFPQLTVHDPHGLDVPLVPLLFDGGEEQQDEQVYVKKHFTSSTPFDLIGPNKAIKLQLFRTAMTIEGLCFFSNGAMGPNAAHGGSVFTCIVQFFESAMHILYGPIYILSNVTISYDKSTPLACVALLTGFHVAPVHTKHFNSSSSKLLSSSLVFAYVNLGSEDKTQVYVRAQARFEKIESQPPQQGSISLL